MNRNWTGKLQVTLLIALFSERNILAHFQSLFGEVILIYSEKLKAKYMNEGGCVNSFVR